MEVVAFYPEGERIFTSPDWHKLARPDGRMIFDTARRDAGPTQPRAPLERPRPALERRIRVNAFAPPTPSSTHRAPRAYATPASRVNSPRQATSALGAHWRRTRNLSAPTYVMARAPLERPRRASERRVGDNAPATPASRETSTRWTPGAVRAAWGSTRKGGTSRTRCLKRPLASLSSA